MGKMFKKNFSFFYLQAQPKRTMGPFRRKILIYFGKYQFYFIKLLKASMIVIN